MMMGFYCGCRCCFVISGSAGLAENVGDRGDVTATCSTLKVFTIISNIEACSLSVAEAAVDVPPSRHFVVSLYPFH